MSGAVAKALPAEEWLDTPIPLELRALPQWVAWWSVVAEGARVRLPGGGYTKPLKKQEKPHKLPINPMTGGLAASTRPKTWSSLKDALAAVQRWSVTGVGFVFTASDPYAGVDLDNCRHPETGEIAEWALAIIRALDSYTEVSPSRTGVHIIIRGQLPSGRGNQCVYNGGKVEMFSRARYFTFTGNLIDGSPTVVRDRHAELLALHSELFCIRRSIGVARDFAPLHPLASDAELIGKACQAKNGNKFKRLWAGLWEGNYPSQSEADSGLCCLLAFWIGNDPVRIDSLFRQSGLMRDKWDNGSYAERTIDAALAVASAAYQPGRRSASRRRPAPTPGEVEGGDGGSNPRPDLVHFPHTDTGNAERLVLMHGSDLRFCTETKKWLAWDGRRWTSEDSRQVKRVFKNTTREMYRETAAVTDKDQRELAERHARQSEAAAKIRAALECAECEIGIGVSANSLDTHPFLLNCLNGTLDLRAAKLRAHDRHDLITKIVHVHYRAHASCPQFLQKRRKAAL